MNPGKLFFDKKMMIAGIFYFSACIAVLSIFGIQTGGEAEKYIDNANRILTGRELRNGFFGFFYVVYSLLVTLFVWLKINLFFVGIVQVVLSFTAAFCGYSMVKSIWQKEEIAFGFFLVYLLCYPIQKWNFHLYSDGVHTSLLLIGLYTLYRLIKQTTSAAWLFFITMFLLILFSRPTGIIFAGCSLIVLLAWFHKQKWNKAFYFGTGLAVTFTIMVFASPLTAFVNPDSIKRMEVICQVPQVNTDSSYQEFNKAGLYKAFQVIKDEVGFGNFIKTGFKKLLYFFGMYRSYYSLPNNLLLLLFTILYPLMLLGIWFKSSTEAGYVWLFSVLYIAATCVAIFFTCDDWANRFISPVFPFILILAAEGFLSVYSSLSKKPDTK